MADETPPETGTSGFDRDYDAIEAAVLETARGRWFLTEFARRNRFAETDKLLGAIQRLGETEQPSPRTAAPAPARSPDADLAALIDGVRSVEAALAALGPTDESRLVAPDARGFDRLVEHPDDANLILMDAAEGIQEAIWSLREGGAAPRLCDELDRRATQIFAVCEFQALAIRRHGAVAASFARLQDLAGSTARRRHLPASRPRASPARVPPAARTDVAPPPPAPAPVAIAEPIRPDPPRPAGERMPATEERPLPRPSTLADIDALTAREKLRLFT